MSDGIDIQGGLLTRDFMERLRIGDVPGAKPADYVVPGRLEDAVTAAWGQLRNAWSQFQIKKARVNASDHEEAYRVTRDDWLKFVFDVLRYGYLSEQKPLSIEGKVYPIKFSFNGVPIEVVGYNQDLDEGPSGTARGNPHSQLQEYLNRMGKDAWGILTNGHAWRILRNNASSTRPAYIEFNLESVMERFDEFALWWRIAHSSRISGESPWLERWMNEADRQGTRALEALRKGVEQAIEILGAGFLKHPRNRDLHQRLENMALPAQDYYHQVLRLVYRLIFLFVTEDRGILLDPKASEETKRLFAENYSTKRLRRLAHEVRGSQHHDQFEGLKVVMNGLKDPKGCGDLGIAGLNGSLWSREFIPDLDAASIRNVHFLQAIRCLTRIQREKGAFQAVDYQRLASEELGSIYESLLELEAEVQPRERSFKLAFAKGNERRTTGSHYTPTDLIDLVLDHALNPRLDEAQKNTDPEKALLALTVCDPTCGSGHFLIAAAHRIAHRVAQARTGEFEPGLNEKRRALRDVVGRCIYGVDINPLSVELAKVGLWLEAMEPGKPLTFLDHHIKCGNALLGAFPNYLEAGIPSQAYNPREGIDRPEVCRELVNLNKRLPMDQARLSSFRADAVRVERVLADALARIDAMPDTTVPEILAKEAEYDRIYTKSAEYERYKQALDAWCAAFTYAKTSVTSEANVTNGQLIDFLHPDGAHGKEVLALILQEAQKSGNRFLHWYLEFPSVARRGGFSVILGNPPYMGGRKISTTLGEHYRSFIDHEYHEPHGKADLAAIFLRRFSRLVAPDGAIGLVTTNTLGQGATREVGLGHLVRQGFVITFAKTDIEWSGAASVIVSLVVLSKQQRPPILDGNPVDAISSRLDALPENELGPVRAQPKIVFEGNKPAGKGFLLEIKEAERLSTLPNASAVIKPYLTGEDLFGEVGQRPSRFIIFFRDWSLEQARAWPEILEIVETKVKPERATASTPSWREAWWQFGKFAKAMEAAISDLEYVVLRPGTSETPLFIRVPNNACFSSSLFVFASDDWHLVGELNSGIHEAWYRKQGSGMKQDVRYTPGSCYDTFPRLVHDAPVAEMGKRFQEMVIDGAAERGLSLTRLWGLVNDPAVESSDIAEIRKARDELTTTVAKGYGMEGIDFRFGHYRDHASRWRYSMHPEAADQVYTHLVLLNATQTTQGSSSVTVGRVGHKQLQL